MKLRSSRRLSSHVLFDLFILVDLAVMNRNGKSNAVGMRGLSRGFTSGTGSYRRPPYFDLSVPFGRRGNLNVKLNQIRKPSLAVFGNSNCSAWVFSANANLASELLLGLCHAAKDLCQCGLNKII